MVLVIISPHVVIELSTELYPHVCDMSTTRSEVHRRAVYGVRTERSAGFGPSGLRPFGPGGLRRSDRAVYGVRTERTSRSGAMSSRPGWSRARQTRSLKCRAI